jgi:hypothetical protein
MKATQGRWWQRRRIKSVLQMTPWVSLTDQSFDGFDRADAQIFTGVPQNALLSKTVENGAHDRAGSADEIRQLLLGQADVRAETVLAPSASTMREPRAG